MTATFQSLKDTRAPKALKAISLLSNLTRYDHAEHEAKALVNSLLDAVDEVDAAFAKKWGWPAEDDIVPLTDDQMDEKMLNEVKFAGIDTDKDGFDKEEQAILRGTADGGAQALDEVRWAIDAIKRGDDKLALNRLTRVLKGSDT